MTETVWKAPETLVARYGPEDLDIFDERERDRFVAPFGGLAVAAARGDEQAWAEMAPHIAAEILYRKEPDLYERLIAGERIHPAVIDWLPTGLSTIVEVAAGTGRLTMDLLGRCEHLIAVEPVAAFRTLLASKAEHAGVKNLEIRSGFFDDVPVSSRSADLVVSCSALTSDPWHGGENGLRELERVASPGALVVLVWPADVSWLREHGFNYQSFPGEMFVDFPSAEAAAEIARIFYPKAADEIVAGSLERVPYDVLGMNPPRDLAWKRVS